MAKSTVNKSGNYTKPTMRKQLFQRIKSGGKGGKPGQCLPSSTKLKVVDISNGTNKATKITQILDKTKVENQEWQA
jgi:hypothetical protein